MKPFFTGDERLMKLVYVAGTWVGTRWAANSHAKGCGVACHNLPVAIYKECGALPNDFPWMIGDPAKDKHAKESRMAKVIDSRSEFTRVDGELMPGDLIGIRVYRVIDHLGLVLPNNTWIHVMMHKNTSIDLMVSPWKERISAAWRIHE